MEQRRIQDLPKNINMTFLYIEETKSKNMWNAKQIIDGGEN